MEEGEAKEFEGGSRPLGGHPGLLPLLTWRKAVGQLSENCHHWVLQASKECSLSAEVCPVWVLTTGKPLSQTEMTAFLIEFSMVLPCPLDVRLLKGHSQGSTPHSEGPRPEASAKEFIIILSVLRNFTKDSDPQNTRTFQAALLSCIS